MNYTNRNQNIDIYFREIHSNSSMTREDEIALFTRISKGDKSAETEIFNKMAKLAVNIAKTYTGKSDLLEDLIQEANMGVLDAIKKFDLSMGWRFSSYARFWMKSYVSKFLNETGTVHKNPNNLDFKISKIKKEFNKTHDHSISVYELMDALEEMGEIVNDPSALVEICVSSINETVGDDEKTTEETVSEFAMTTASRNEFEDECDREELSYEIRKKMSILSDREKLFVLKKFGIGYDCPKEIEDITREYNTNHPEKTLTEERVRQIIAGAIKKMKK